MKSANTARPFSPGSDAIRRLNAIAQSVKAIALARNRVKSDRLLYLRRILAVRFDRDCAGLQSSQEGEEMNVKLLRKVKKHILEEPRRFVMRTWRLTRSREGRTFYSDAKRDGLLQSVEFANCNTAACIGGWALILEGRTIRTGFDVGKRAAALLGIDEEEGSRLFAVDEWPRKFRERYHDATTQEELVKIAAERIDHFVKTKGAE